MSLPLPKSIAIIVNINRYFMNMESKFIDLIYEFTCIFHAIHGEANTIYNLYFDKTITIMSIC